MESTILPSTFVAPLLLFQGFPSSDTLLLFSHVCPCHKLFDNHKMPVLNFFFALLLLSCYVKKLYGPFLLWMGFNCLKATATSRMQFTFYHSVPRNSWYSFYRLRKDERLSRPWSHPVALITGPLDWESSALTTRPLSMADRLFSALWNKFQVGSCLKCYSFLHVSSCMLQQFMKRLIRMRR